MSSVQDEDLARAEKGIPVEEAPPMEASEKTSMSRRKLWIIVVGLLVLLAIVGLTVGLVLRSQQQKNESLDNGLTGNSSEGDTQPTTLPPPEPTGTPFLPKVPPTNSPVGSTATPPTTNTPTVSSTTPESPLEETRFYQSSSGIFNVTLPLFSSSVVLGYADEDELKRDLVEAVKFKINRAVEQDQFYIQPADEQLAASDGGEANFADGSRPASSPVAGDVDDYGTNTVESSIDEGDLLKVNGDYAFAAYGQYVVIWDVKTGEQVTNITLPSLTYDGQQPPKESYEIAETGTGDIGFATGSDGGGRKRNLQIIADDYWYWPAEPTVQSLLLHQDRLVVIANGYGQFLRNELDYMPVFYDAFSTNVRVYDISQLNTTGEVSFITERHVHGTFNSIRADENKVHLVTFSSLDTWSYLEQPLSQLRTLQDLDDEAYAEAARQLAEDELIPNFVNQLMQDLSVDGEPPNISRISMWQKHLSADSRLEDVVFQQGVISSFAQVTSFDMLDDSEDLKLTKSGTFMPTGWGHTYATSEMLVIAGQGWDWIADMNGSVQTTYLHGFALQEDGSATPVAVGSLDGSLLNEYSVDVVENHMRVAVTIRNDFWTFAPVDGDGTENVEPPTPRTENYIVVLEIPDTANADGGGAIMKEVGRTENLGEDGEVFTSVRFSDKIAYAVTFEQTDPFYVISFENATNPEVLGELKITGFASYLHFVNDENTLLLGVGQEADEDGLRLGLQVTLYNSTDPTQPSIIDRYPFELDPGVYSSSSAEFDFKAFRYVKLDAEEDVGILIIPVRVDSFTSTEGNFDGFVLLDVSSSGIEERFSIPHVDSADFRLGCYYWARLAERSFVVGGNVTTLKGHSIRNYNLDSRQRRWGLDLDVGRVSQDYCAFW